MACTQPTNLQLVWKSGPRALTGTWSYAGKKPSKFYVRLMRYNAARGTWEIFQQYTTGPSARGLSFTKLGSDSESFFRLDVAALCACCGATGYAQSDPIASGCCIPLDFVAAWDVRFFENEWFFEIVKTELDQMCKTDKVYCEQTQPSMAIMYHTAPRDEWFSLNGDYRAIFDAPSDVGTHRFRFKKQLDCGTESDWSDYYDVEIVV